jgi:hypothetical protein
MDIDINLSGLKFHFFSKNTNNYIDKMPKLKSKIIKHDFYAVNELQICEKIKKINYYINSYHIVDSYDFINISQLNDKYIDKININNKTRYLTLNYKNNDFTNFNSFLLNFDDIKLLIFNIIESFSYLLNSLYSLNEHNICFFNLCPQNIVLLNNCGEKPILQNFKYSLRYEKLNEEYFSKIINNLNDNYIYKPIEVHVLFYLIKNDINTISYSFIEEICEIYVNNLSVLQFFSQKYVEDYKKSCIETLKKYINQDKREIIKILLKNIELWDIFSISVLYLHIIGNILQIFSLQGTFISKLFVELSKNIHPNPEKRYDLETMREIYNKLFNEETDWKYINNLKNDKIFTLIENLQQ